MKDVQQQLEAEWDCGHLYCLCLIYLPHFLPC